MTISEQGGYVPRYASAPPMMEATAKAVPIEPGTEKLDIEFTNQFHFWPGLWYKLGRTILRQRVAFLNFRTSPGHFGRGFFVPTSGEPL
jgi:hypothetical protein